MWRGGDDAVIVSFSAYMFAYEFQTWDDDQSGGLMVGSRSSVTRLGTNLYDAAVTMFSG